MKKLFALLLVLAIAIACFAGCAAPTEQPDVTPGTTTPDTTPDDTMKVLEFSVMEHGPYAANTAQYLLEDWGLKCVKVIKTPPGDVSTTNEFQENMLKMFAGNDTPDWMPGWSFNWQNPDEPFKEIGDKGKLVDLLPYVEAGKLNNYVQGVWGDAMYAWDFCKSCLGSRTTGKLYILPIRNYEVAYYTWLYNKNYFETELDMDAPPTDLAQVIQIMKTFATENDGCSAMLYDWGPSNNDAWGQWGYYEREPIFNACGVLHSNEWRTHNGAVEYGLMQDAYLKAISAYRDLMNTNTIFAQDSKNVETGKGIYANKQEALQNDGAIFAWDSFNGLADINNKAQAGNPGYEWAVVPEDPTFEGLSPIGYNNMPFGWSGKVIGATASQELIDRLIAFIDWSASKEGEMRQQFGIEDVSYKLVDGKVKFLKYYNDTYTPEMEQTNVLTEQLDYYRFGLEHKSNYDFIANLTVYTSAKYQYQEAVYNKIQGMITKGQCNYPGAWGSTDAAAQAVNKTAAEMEAMDAAVTSVCGAWRSKYYANEVDDESFAQMKQDAIAAGYELVLEYRWAMLLDAMPKLAANPYK
ncbi:MAG: hypothetical protein E7315_02110 [Clostridiales bacterium]|nr:hypothetical protein [Clostridiales bacterium]